MSFRTEDDTKLIAAFIQWQDANKDLILPEWSEAEIAERFISSRHQGREAGGGDGGAVIEAFYKDEMITQHCGNMREVLPLLGENSLDSSVTDPPYELGFMNKHWDKSGVAFSVDTWKALHRVLKPGAHLLAFSGTRTYHRMAVAIEDAGFEIRDSIHWTYASGFPKSLDVSKAIDKRGGNAHLTREVGRAIKEARERRGLSVKQCDVQFCGGTTNWSWFEGRPTGQRSPTSETFNRIAAEWPELLSLAEKLAEAEREIVGTSGHRSGIGNATEGHYTVGGTVANYYDITAPATDAAKQWQGWGTAIKPAHEIICLARKPLSEPNVAANVLRWGTGALNIDKCRIPAQSQADIDSQHRVVGFNRSYSNGEAGRVLSGSADGSLRKRDRTEFNPEQGRWPANVILSHDPNCNGKCVEGCPVAMLDGQSGQSVSTGDARHNSKGVLKFQGENSRPSHGEGGHTTKGHVDRGGASRFYHIAEWSDEDFLIPFYYTAKASRAERDKGLEYADTLTMNRVNPGGLEHDPKWGPTQVKNNHATVKPIKLLRYLIRLITPPGGTVIDPFSGSGSTLRAAEIEGFKAVGIELDEQHCKIAAGRITGNLPPLFR